MANLNYAAFAKEKESLKNGEEHRRLYVQLSKAEPNCAEQSCGKSFRVDRG